SFFQPKYTSEVNYMGVMNLLETIRQSSNIDPKKIKFYQASTSEQFGAVVETPQRETTPFNPQSPYAVSKTAAFQLVRIYRQGYNLFACNGLLFNHESPRRGLNFVTKKVIAAIAQIALSRKAAPLIVGNLEAKRDWGHARDYVQG